MAGFRSSLWIAAGLACARPSPGQANKEAVPPSGVAPETNEARIMIPDDIQKHTAFLATLLEQTRVDTHELDEIIGEPLRSARW